MEFITSEHVSVLSYPILQHFSDKLLNYIINWEKLNMEWTRVQVLSFQITHKSVPDLQFSSICGESSFFEEE
uniref:Uncharacterized protein n=1 Tax=Solanum tuberosum TaxID=4113 RepID=M1DTZ7_SOLTU